MRQYRAACSARLARSACARTASHRTSCRPDPGPRRWPPVPHAPPRSAHGPRPRRTSPQRAGAHRAGRSRVRPRQTRTHPRKPGRASRCQGVNPDRLVSRRSPAQQALDRHVRLIRTRLTAATGRLRAGRYGPTLPTNSPPRLRTRTSRWVLTGGSEVIGCTALLDQSPAWFWTEREHAGPALVMTGAGQQTYRALRSLN